MFSEPFSTFTSGTSHSYAICHAPVANALINLCPEISLILWNIGTMITKSSTALSGVGSTLGLDSGLANKMVSRFNEFLNYAKVLEWAMSFEAMELRQASSEVTI